MTLLIVGGLLLEVCLAVAAGLATAAPRWMLPALLAAGVPYFVAVWRAPTLDWKRARWWILGVALAGRLVFLPSPIRLSDDVYRYLWEGRVQRAGFNPYRFAPDSPELEALHDSNWERVAHGEVPSAYPPLLLLVFRGAARFSADPRIFKCVFTGFDLLTLGLLVCLLRRQGRSESLALVWAWNPLVILEFAGNGHEMSLAICCFVAGLWGLACRVPTLNAAAAFGAGAAFGAAMMSHLLAVPLVLAVVVAGRVKSLPFWGALAAVGLGATAGFADAGVNLLVGLLHFAGRWQFNGSLFEVLARGLGDAASLRQVSDTVWFAQGATKCLMALAWLAVLAWIAWRRYAPARAALAAGAALLLLSPVVHPWYVTWLVALTCLEFRVTWVTFSALVLVSYAARLTELETDIWRETSLVRWLEYAPLYLLLAAELWRGRGHDVAIRLSKGTTVAL